MRLLIFSQNDSGVAKALARRHQVLTVWPRREAPSDLHYDPAVETLESLLARLPNRFDPEAILLVNLDYENFLWGLQDARVPVVAPVSDINLCFDLFRSAAPFVDLFVCNESSQVEPLTRAGARATYMPWFGLDSDVFRPGEEAPIWDVVFVGNLSAEVHRERGKILEQLLLAGDRFEVRVLGGLYGEDYVRALRRGRIVLNQTIRGELNMRVFETLGVRRLLFVEESNEEVGRYFRPGEHYVTFNWENLLERLEYYLAHVGEREEIAARGHAEALARHTLGDRAEELASLVQELVASPPPRKPLSRSALHEAASRVFMHHGRMEAALEHAAAALGEDPSDVAQANLLRVLGSQVPRDGSRDAVERFTEAARATEQKSILTALNELEVKRVLGCLEEDEIRRFIDRLKATTELELDAREGPVKLAYDTFRITWERLLLTDTGTNGTDPKRDLLLARAYEILGDVESELKRPLDAVEAYTQSLALFPTGYVRHKLGVSSYRLGRREEAQAELERAVAEEPFFFQARRDLAMVLLDGKRFDAARRSAGETLAFVTPAAQAAQYVFADALHAASVPQERARYEGDRPILWDGVFADTSGYARETRLLVKALKERDLPLTFSDHARSSPGALSDAEAELLLSLRGERPKAPCVHVLHLPNCFHREGSSARTVARLTFETDRLPAGWREVLESTDRVWVMSEFNKRVFSDCGVDPGRIAVVPSPLGEPATPRPEPVRVLGAEGFTFLSVFAWSVRKGWDVLLRAYVEEFRPSDDVSLVLRVDSWDGQSHVEVRDRAREFLRSELGRDPDRTPPILFVDEALTDGEIRGLYRDADCFVLPSRGEGFGRPYLEALLEGLPVIATRWGGHVDFLNDDNAYLLEIEGLEDCPREDPRFAGHRWATPSVDHLRQLMRRVYDDPEGGRQRARRGMAEILEKYNVERVANLVVDELNQIVA